MAESQNTSWGLLPRIVVAAIAAMVLSLALKPYESKLTPFVKKIKESTIAKVSFDPSTSGKRIQANKSEESNVSKESLPERIEKSKDKSQLKSVLEKL
jgi:hypothetical protein